MIDEGYRRATEPAPGPSATVEPREFTVPVIRPARGNGRRIIAGFLLVLGVISLLVGQHFMGEGLRLRGFPWYLLGAIGIALAAWIPTTALRPSAALRAQLDRLGGVIVPAATVGVVGSALIACALARGRGLSEPVWDVTAFLVLGFTFLAILATHGWTVPSLDGLGRARVRHWPWRVIAAMSIVMVFAILVRSWRLDQFATVSTGDDWFHAKIAREFRNGEIPNPFRMHFFLIPMDLTAAFRGWIARPFPDETASYRLFSVLYGVATVFGVFLLGRRTLGLWEGIAGAASMAAMSLHIWGSRTTLNNAFDAFVMVFALWFLDRAMVGRERRDAIACGIVLGIGLYGYWGSRVFPAFIAVTLVVMLITPDWRRQLVAMVRTGGWILVGFIVPAAPAIAFWLDEPKQFMARTNTVTGSIAPGLLERAELVFRALVFPFHAQQGFGAASFYRQDSPFLGWSIAPFHAIGAVVWVAWLVVQLRKHGAAPRRPALLLLIWIVTIVPISQTESMGSHRFFGVAPIWALAAGTGIVVVIEAIRGILTRDRWLSVVLACLMMTALSADAIHQTFFAQPQRFEDAYAVRSWDLGWRFQTADASLAVLQAGWPEISYDGAGAWQFLSPTLAGRLSTFDQPFDTIPEGAPVLAADQVLILAPERAGETCTILNHNPTVFIAEATDGDGRMLYRIFSLDEAFDGIRLDHSAARVDLAPIPHPAC